MDLLKSSSKRSISFVWTFEQSSVHRGLRVSISMVDDRHNQASSSYYI